MVNVKIPTKPTVNSKANLNQFRTIAPCTSNYPQTLGQSQVVCSNFKENVNKSLGGSFHGELLVITRWYICHFMEIFHGIYMWILDKRSPNYLIGKLGSICGASSKKQLGLTNTKRRGAFRNLAIKKMDHLWDHHLVSHWVTQITIFGKLP